MTKELLTKQTISKRGSYLGPEFTDTEIQQYLDENDIPYQKLEGSIFLNTAASLIAREKVIGRFQGPMEFGPRALGARSIIGASRSEKMQETMNLKLSSGRTSGRLLHLF